MDEVIAKMNNEIQGLKRKFLYLAIIFTILGISYNLTLMQCLNNCSQVRYYYEECSQRNQELLTVLDKVNSQCQQIVEDYEAIQQFLYQNQK